MDNLRTIDHEQWRVAGGPTGGHPEAPEHRRKLCNPSSAKLFNRLKILILRPCRTMPFARSTYPFVWGCATAAQSTRMWYSLQNQRNFFLVNCASLSMKIEFGTPKRWTMSRKNSMACSDLIVEISQASIHFVNLSTVTSKCV